VENEAGEQAAQDRAMNLDAESILAEAREKTGLDHFGDDSFREPMQRLLRSLEEEAELSPTGRAMQRARVVGLLVNRLRAQDHFERHPEIFEQELREPLVIVGLARTGTTMLHRMIASDPRMISLLWWESRNPAPFPEPGDGGRDPRIADAQAEVAAMIEGAPDLVAIHPIQAEEPDEEIMLLEHSFFSTNSEAFVNVPTFSAWLDRQDQTPGYLYLKKLLQLLQWQKGRAGGAGERWVLKTPHHLGFMDLVFAVFPDARVVQTHRDPLQTIPSLASLIHAIRILGSDGADPVVAGRQWSDRMSRALRRCMEVRESHEDRFIDVWFADAMRDPLAQIRRIYDFAGMELTPEAEANMRQWRVDNARDKRVAHSYSLEQFGLSERGIQRDFAAYRERFITSRT
jgi:hypothetical protein